MLDNFPEALYEKSAAAGFEAAVMGLSARTNPHWGDFEHPLYDVWLAGFAMAAFSTGRIIPSNITVLH